MSAANHHPVVPATVPFYQNTLLTAETNGQKYAAMKPIVEGMGLAWQSQQAKIRASKRFDDIVIPLQTPGGIQEMVCIPMQKLNGWLFSVNSDKVKPEIKEKILRYQEECFVVLYDYWHKGAAVNEHSGVTAPAVLDTEILKSLLATSQAVAGLRENLSILSSVAESLDQLQETSRTMSASVEQLSQIAHIESAVRTHIDQFRSDFRKVSDLAYQRSANDSLTMHRMEEGLRILKHAVDAMGKRLDQEDQTRGGLMGYLEKYLPKYEAADIKTTPNITPDNDPERFIRECCTVDPFASVELIFLYKVYKAWSLSRFAQAIGPVNFWEHIQDRLPKNVSVESRKSKRMVIGMKPVSKILIEE